MRYIGYNIKKKNIHKKKLTAFLLATLYIEEPAIAYRDIDRLRHIILYNVK